VRTRASGDLTVFDPVNAPSSGARDAHNTSVEEVVSAPPRAPAPLIMSLSSSGEAKVRSARVSRCVLRGACALGPRQAVVPRACACNVVVCGCARCGQQVWRMRPTGIEEAWVAGVPEGAGTFDFSGLRVALASAEGPGATIRDAGTGAVVASFRDVRERARRRRGGYKRTRYY
jgi:hypothetical protein